MYREDKNIGMSTCGRANTTPEAHAECVEKVAARQVVSGMPSPQGHICQRTLRLKYTLLLIAAYYEQCLPTTDASGRTRNVHHAPRAQQSAGAESSRGESFRIHVSELGVTAEETGRHACVWLEPGKGFYIHIKRKTYQCKLRVLLGPPLKVTFPRFPSWAPSPFDSPVHATAPLRHGLDNDDARPSGKEKAGSTKGLAIVEGRERLAPEAEAGPDRGLGKGRKGEYNG